LIAHNVVISSINFTHKTDISLLTGTWHADWFNEARLWHKGLAIEIKQEETRLRNKNIHTAIEDRCADLLYNQKRMINSILERPYRRIIVDCLKIDIGNGEELFLTEPDDILNHGMDTYNQQFHR
jgi:hypothetical protein